MLDEQNKIIGFEGARTAKIDRDRIVRNDEGEATRSVWVAVSSEAPYERWFGTEILEHRAENIDLAFMKSGTAPLLLQHDHGEQIGVVEEVRLDDDRVLRALVRFGKGARASEVYEDVLDGIRMNISVGYRINEINRTEREGQPDEVRVTEWSPYEVSIVSVPADTGVGVGRSSGEKPQSTPIKKEKTMTEQVVDREAIEREIRAEVAADAERAQADADKAVETRAAEVAEIMQLGARHNLSDEAVKHVKDKKSLSAFRGLVLDNIGDSGKPLVDTTIGMTEREMASFSVFKLARAQAKGASKSDIEAATLEIEAAAAAAEHRTTERSGAFAIPQEVLDNFITPEMKRMMGDNNQVRTLLAGTDTSLIPTEHRASSFIELLRAQAVVMAAGAMTIPGLSGNVDIPRRATTGGAQWISAEHGDSTDGEPTFDDVQLTPKDISVSTPMSRRMRQQSSPAIEGLVRIGIVADMALGIDLAALEGSGAAGQPEGVLNITGVNKPTAFVGANPTFAEVVAMETAVADDNALMGSLAYIGRSNMRGALKTTAKDAGSGIFLMDGNVLNGYSYLLSNQITDGHLYFGNWSDLMIGFWSGLDLMFDEYTLAAKNGLYIRAFQTCDVAVRHPESFCYNT